MVTPNNKITIKDKAEIFIIHPDGTLSSTNAKEGTYTVSRTHTHPVAGIWHSRNYPTIQTAMVDGKEIQYKGWFIMDSGTKTSSDSV